MLVFVPKQQILSCKLIVFAFEKYFEFAILQSNLHEVWLRRFATTLRTDVTYIISNCFETFPFPISPSVDAIEFAEISGRKFYEYRQKVTQKRQIGLTKLNNLFNDPTCMEEDIKIIRELLIDLDKSILACYGWEGIDLQHDFYPNDRKKIRFIPSPAAQREIFTRLVALNQEIAAQEAAQGVVVEAGEEDEIDEETEA